MEFTPILIGIAIGGVIAYIFFTLLSKGKNVARTEYDALNARLNETSTNLKLTEDRLKSQQELATERIKELQEILREQTETNKTQQAEVNNAKLDAAPKSGTWP